MAGDYFMTKILIAEDERDIRDLVAFSLQFGGFTVVQAANGAEAVERAQAELPDLIASPNPLDYFDFYRADR